jgi:predicted outer membrane protein
MKTKASTGFTRRLLTTAAAVIGLAPAAFAQASGAQAGDPQTFFVLNNPNDTMFISCLVSTTEMSSSAISVMAI